MTVITGIGGTPTLSLTASLRAGAAGELQNSSFARNAPSVSAATARAVIVAAQNGGADVLSLLGKMQSLTFAAANIGRLTGDPFSRETHQMQINLLLTQLDRTVEGASFEGINLLSPNAAITSFRTTAFGGSLEVGPKPLDTNTLRLSGLSVIGDGDISNAMTRLNTAINRATARLSQIGGLTQAFAAGTSFLSQISGTSDRSLGSQINLLA
jgi:flagellin-like hook-associated protein FlgL